MYTQDPPPYLPRGGACVVCRAKKIKCDGNRPKCNQCNRFGRIAECEYSDRPAPDVRRVLEGHVSYLENRIRELEREKALASPRSTPGDTSSVSHPSEPPPDVAQYLTSQFLPHARQLGCFLDIRRAFSQQPQETYASGALRAVVYLWGAKLSGNVDYTHQEPTYLANALHWVRAAFGSAQQYRRITLHLLQTGVLVANYMFSSGRLFEGQSHYSVLVALALKCGLHKLCRTPADSRTSSWLVPSASPAEDAEKVSAWWSIYTLEKSWSALLDVPSVLNERGGPDTVIDTPWPLASANVAHHGQTVRSFMYDVRTGLSPSPLAFQAKAAILLDLSTEVASYQGDPQQLHNMVTALDQAIEIFKTLLPALVRPTHAPLSLSDAHNLLVVHSLVHVATIRLFRSSSAANKDAKCFTSAFAIVNLINQANVQQMTYVHPLLAMVWGIVCEVLVPPLLQFRMNPQAGSSSMISRQDLEGMLTHLRNAMESSAPK
ncbi:hypothetical protein BC835DRAFT_1410320 [Cytidiella melzeri]|nr:hypothetical protein BC835DRAFT_1410320 [Cytidiella melzeri]